MYTFTKREWEIMNRPLFPNIEFTSSKNAFQIQSMVKLDIPNENYYFAYVFVKDICNFKDLEDFLKLYSSQVEYIKDTLSPETEDEYEQKRLYKIVEDK